MKAKLQKKLFDKYPKIFRQKDLPMTETCMCWGIDCGDGWYWLLDHLCGAIQSYTKSRNEGVRIRNKANNRFWKRLKIWLKYGRWGSFLKTVLFYKKEFEWEVEAVQVKEKFGSLRFYINTGDDWVYGMISFAEHLSFNICEQCGSIKDIVHTKGWITTLCKPCLKEKEKDKT